MEDSDYLKAFVDIKIGDELLIKGIRLLSSKKGELFVSMPSDKSKEGKYFETVKVLTDEAKNELHDVILNAYKS